MHRAEHVEVHGSANECIEAASASGWVGASSQALKGKIEDLRAVTSMISDTLEHHSAAFHKGGVRYLDADAGSAAGLDEQMSTLSDADPR